MTTAQMAKDGRFLPRMVNGRKVYVRYAHDFAVEWASLRGDLADSEFHCITVADSLRLGARLRVIRKAADCPPGMFLGPRIDREVRA